MTDLAVEPVEPTAVEPTTGDPATPVQPEPVEPVSPEPVEPTDPPDPNDPEPTPADPAAPTEPRKGNRTQKRINELTRNKSDAERERDYWRDEALKQQRGQQEPAVEQAITAPPMPPDKFDFDSDAAGDAAFLEAKATYQTDHAKYIQHEVGKLAKKQEDDRGQQSAQNARDEAVQTLEKKLDSGYDKYDDFDEVLHNQAVPWTFEIASALVYADNSADIAYQIGKDPELAHKLSLMPPAQQSREIAILDAKIGATTKSTTKAPAPIKTVKQNGGPSKPLDPKNDYVAWAAERNKQERGR